MQALVVGGQAGQQHVAGVAGLSATGAAPLHRHGQGVAQLVATAEPLQYLAKSAAKLQAVSVGGGWGGGVGRGFPYRCGGWLRVGFCVSSFWSGLIYSTTHATLASVT